MIAGAMDSGTREKLRTVVESSLIGVSALDANDDERIERSGPVSSPIMGLAMTRHVWKVEPVASMTDDEVVAAVAPNLQRYIDGAYCR